MSADIEKLWHLYFGHNDDKFRDDNEDCKNVYTPDDNRIAAIETFVSIFMDVCAIHMSSPFL